MSKMIEISLGKAGSIQVDVEKLEQHPAVVEYIFNYGLKQMLNDVHASEKDLAAKPGLSQKKLDSLYRGEVAQQRVGGGDPVAREMREMALADIKTKLRAAGRKWSDVAKETQAKVLAAQLEKNAEAYRKAAEAKLAIKPKAVDADDIMSLLD
jgi:hypothetical protein